MALNQITSKSIKTGTVTADDLHTTLDFSTKTFTMHNSHITETMVTQHSAPIIAQITDSAPATLDTLNELASALGDDPNFSTTVTNSIAGKLPLTGGTITGPLTVDVADFYVKHTTNGLQGEVHLGASATQGFINLQKSDGTRSVQLSADADTYFKGGNVGIGTSNPSTTNGGYDDGTLHVHNETGTGSSIRLTNPTTGTSGEVGLLISKWSDSNTYITNFDHGADIVVTPTDSGGNLVASTFVIKGDGKVGFGTSSPTAKVEVTATTATNTTSVAAIGGGSLNTLGGDTVTGRLFFTGSSSNGTDLYGFQNEPNGLTIYNYTDGQYRLYVHNNGYTGIGTNSPSGQLDVEWSANAPSSGIYLKNTNTGSNAFTGTYYGNTSSDTDAFVGLVGSNNPSYAGARSFLLGTNSSGAVATMVGGTQVHTVAQNSASADGYGLTTPALAQTNQLYNMSGTILFDTIMNNGWYGPMDYANAIKRYADIGSPTYRGNASSYHNSHSGSVFNTTWCTNKELFDMRMGCHFWRVPKSGTYTLTARGAGYTHTAGNGRSLTMDYVLYAGEWLRVVCGAQGEGGSGHCGGAGATAFSVYRQGMHIPVLIAGGGAGTTPNAPGANTSRDARPPSTPGTHTPYIGGHYGARDGMGGHGSIYQHNYGSYIVNWGGGGGGGWGTPGAHGGIGINMQEQASGGAALSADCPHGGYFQGGNAFNGGFGGGGGSGVSSGAAGGGGGWYGGNSTYAVEGTTADDTSYQGGGSYAANSFTDNGAHQSYGQALIQI